MNNTHQQEAAAQLQALHKQKELFVLPNIWDAGGAKIVEAKGFKAIATTSAGIAFANGYSDGEALPFSLLIETVKRISSKISTPLSVDFERGYGEEEGEFYENTKQLLVAGAVGLNIEDGLPNKKISEARSMKKKLQVMNDLKNELGIDFLINSRTDIYWNQIGLEKERLKKTIERANSYFSWGADCVFIPGNIPFNELEIVTKEVAGPINVLLNEQLKNIDALNKIGVKRVSLGSSLSRNSITNLFIQSEQIKKNHFDLLLKDSLTYDYVNQFYGAQEEEK